MWKKYFVSVIAASTDAPTTQNTSIWVTGVFVKPEVCIVTLLSNLEFETCPNGAVSGCSDSAHNFMKASIQGVYNKLEAVKQSRNIL
jgi:hypothetical protein